ncbi:MAG: fibrobacter succinogenes major paralogous domain-containing protein [Ignavibacteriae bacterium]|nr:fibrobacter succinogenes major paralogous domain-containing protein [Ignavibacteriota bacterium]
MQDNDKQNSTDKTDTNVVQKQPERKLVEKDGNIYNTATIGSQEWMVENLNVDHYRNGDMIPEIRDFNVWDTIRTGAWCYYYNDSSYGKTYGKLYNWYAVNDPRGLAPEGWHIPSTDEWIKLTEYLGGRETAGGKLKDTTLWENPNLGATNESGFSAIPVGVRRDEGFVFLGKVCCFWSSSEFDYFYYLGYRYSNFCRIIADKNWGMSVRCITDYPESENKREDKNNYNYSSHNNLNKFWEDFKRAINEDDRNAVLKMTNIPFIDNNYGFYRAGHLSGDEPGFERSLTSLTPEEFLINYKKIFDDCVRKTIRTAKFQTFGKELGIDYPPVNKPGLYKYNDDEYLLFIIHESDCESVEPNMFIFEKINGVFKLSYFPYMP